MDIEQESWIIDFAAKAKEHDEWLAFIKFGKPTLEKNQDLFIELIVNEANRLNEVEDVEARTLCDDCVRIFHELNLKLQMTEAS